MQTDWGSFYGALSAFAGTAFAVTLAARTISQRAVKNEPIPKNRTRKWESVGVTFELAAAAFLALLVPLRGTVPASVLSSLVILLGVLAYIFYCRSFVQQHRAGVRHSWTDWLLLLWVLVPFTAYVVAALYFLGFSLEAGFARELLDHVLFPLSIGYLVLSGVGQAFLWYLRVWERPPSAGPSDSIPDKFTNRETAKDVLT